MTITNDETEFQVVEENGNRSIEIPDPTPSAKSTDEATKVNVNRPIPPPKPISRIPQTETAKTPPKTAQRMPAKAPEEIPLVELRANQWTKYIIEDLNPLLVKGSQGFIGVPDEWMDGVVAKGLDAKGNEITFWTPPLKERLAFSEKEAKSLAKAAAQFSISPMGQVITVWIKSNAQLIAMAGALYVAGSYGYRLMQLKQQADQLKNLMEAQKNVASESVNNHQAANAA